MLEPVSSVVCLLLIVLPTDGGVVSVCPVPVKSIHLYVILVTVVSTVVCMSEAEKYS